MSEGGVNESFLWENQSWGFPNSDNSGGSEEKSGKKSTSNSQTPTGSEPVVATGKKRSGANKKNGKGSVGDQISEGKGGGCGGGGESDHEIHIWTERERRKKMRNMFSNLHALLPQLPPKADKSTVVDEAVSYIKTLQHTLQKLQKQKLERLHGATTLNCDPSAITPQKLAMDSRESFLADQGSSTNNFVINNATNSTFSIPRFPTMFQTWTSPNVILNVCGEDAHISVCSIKKPGLLSAICYVLDKHKLEVVSAHVSSDNSRSMYMIQAHVSPFFFVQP
ncbi:hypothetical protein RJ639_004295 [Escallonia herrerae]|uniref:BHLH domain-containing protein n=1 Tax=Escallonia herrerae TaxID=1293975 RepID=A0AA89AWY5_9ASTE|nr:hypothetical protein RJ639_004295 [Escallonia herrerae]